MKKTMFIGVVLTLFISFFSSPSSSKAAEYSSYQDTDWLNVWRVSSQGYIYTPIALTAQATFNWSYTDSYQNVAQIDRQDLIAQTLAGYWSSFPNASLLPGTMKLRGTSQSLPYTGSYIYDSSYRQVGYYNNGSSGTWYIPDSSPSSGTTLFFTGSGGYQLDTTAQVDFYW